MRAKPVQHAWAGPTSKGNGFDTTDQPVADQWMFHAIAASVDSRFKFAAPVYGCGFLGEDSHWQAKQFQEIKPDPVEKWIRLWDPSQSVFRIQMPTLFCNGINDKIFRPVPWQKTYQLVPAPVTLSLRVKMAHGHPPAGDCDFCGFHSEGRAVATKGARGPRLEFNIPAHSRFKASV